MAPVGTLISGGVETGDRGGGVCGGKFRWAVKRLLGSRCVLDADVSNEFRLDELLTTASG